MEYYPCLTFLRIETPSGPHPLGFSVNVLTWLSQYQILERLDTVVALGISLQMGSSHSVSRVSYEENYDTLGTKGRVTLLKRGSDSDSSY